MKLGVLSMRIAFYARVAAIVLGCLLVTVWVYAQSGPQVTGKTIIDENSTFFSWGVVAVLILGTASAVTAYVQNKNHIGNGDIHHTSGSLSEKFPLKTECVAKHIDVKNDFLRVHQRLDELKAENSASNAKITEDLAFIRGKFEGK